MDALDRQLNPALADIASDQSGECLGQPEPRHKRDRHVLDGDVACRQLFLTEATNQQHDQHAPTQHIERRLRAGGPANM